MQPRVKNIVCALLLIFVVVIYYSNTMTDNGDESGKITIT